MHWVSLQIFPPYIMALGLAPPLCLDRNSQGADKLLFACTDCSETKCCKSWRTYQVVNNVCESPHDRNAEERNA